MSTTQDDTFPLYSEAELANINRLNRLSDNHYMIWHIALMLIAYVGLLPVGVAFGRSRHRLHVPLQIIMVVLAGIGYYLAFHRHDHRTAHQKSRHATTKRFFEKTPHVWLGIILVWLLGFQVAFGIGRKLLKMRWPDQPLANNGDGSNNDRLRGRIARMISLTLSACHRWLGGVHIVIVYLQIMFGIIKLGHFCRADATSMCWERYTTGSLLWWSAIINLLGLVAPRLFGKQWLKTSWNMIALSLSGIVMLVSGYIHRKLLVIGMIWTIGGIAHLIARYIGYDRVRNVQPIPLLVFTITGGILIYYANALTVMAGMCIIMASVLDVIIDWMSWYRQYQYRQISGQATTPTTRRPSRFYGIRLPSIRTMLRLLSITSFLLSGMLVMSSTNEWQRFLAIHGLSTISHLLLLSGITMILLAFTLCLGALVSERVVTNAQYKLQPIAAASLTLDTIRETTH